MSWLLNIETESSLEGVEFFLAAPWARDGAFWLFLAVIVSILGALFYYRYWERRGSGRVRLLLGIVRGVLLALMVVTLANPYLRVTARHPVPRTIQLVFDGTRSMLIGDAGETTSSDLAAGRPISRLEAIQGLLRGESLGELASADCQLEAFLFTGRTTSRLEKLPVSDRPSTARLSSLADHLTAEGRVSALGAALDDLARHYPRRHTAGVIIFSDFAHNSGPLPTADERMEAIRGLGAPIYTVGVGRQELVDLSVELQVEPRMKSGEESLLTVRLRASDLEGRRAEVTARARRIGSPQGSEWIRRRTVELTADAVDLRFPFIPLETGSWEFESAVEPIVGESVRENNVAVRRATVIDDYLRLLYAAFEPSWEWRFVKEAFHRDRLVGLQGFRTFLESSDPGVRRSNPLFLETLPTRRDELFKHDVILLDDPTSSILSPGFVGLLQEFVGGMGGGLVVLAGPRFGLGELAGTSVAEMLPVRVDSELRLRDEGEFVPRLTARAEMFAFMNLDENGERRGWSHLKSIPWYQPVSGVHEQGVVLSQHPTDLCRDGSTHQPLIAVRKYGNGEVVFVAFNELWRLRRGHGERYHRRFWSRLIYRLGMSHALGDDKRFVARTDRESYRVDETVTLTVTAYDLNYELLAEQSVPNGVLRGDLTVLAGGAADTARRLIIPWSREGRFETRFAVSTAGQYTVSVTDPVTGDERQVGFSVSDTTAELRNAVRDARIQRELAIRTNGKSYEMSDAGKLLDDLDLSPRMESSVWTRSLWSTPLWFILVTGLMLCEWLTRRWIHLK